MATSDDRKPLGGGWWARPRVRTDVLDLTAAMAVKDGVVVTQLRRFARFAAAAKVPELQDVPAR